MIAADLAAAAEQVQALWDDLTPEQQALALALLEGGNPDARKLEAHGWQTWLRTLGPATFTGSFAQFHCEFWGWYWRITQKRQAGESLTGEEWAFLAIWARGNGKSANVEWAAICEGALLSQGYVLYVSGTRELAEGHVASIRERIESSQIARYYPHLASPKVGRHGNQYGWRQDFLITAGGWAIRPLGLREGVRGGRVGDLRPTLIILDDVDDHADSPVVVQTKLDTIARSIIPAGTTGTIVLGAQNLIHRNSVFNQIVTRKSGILSDRIVSGPHPAFRDVEITHEQTPEGPRAVIVRAEPVWDDLDITAAQKFLSGSGPEAFLAEYQHDFTASEQGRVLKEYDEAVHVITWSQFESVFGVRYVPEHWQRYVGHDVGFTPGHLSAWVWLATSAANTKLPGMVFRYRGLTFSEPQLDEMALTVRRAMLPDEASGRRFDEFPLIYLWRMSHEALSERKTYRVKHHFPFLACKSGKTDGLSQWRHYLRADRSRAHPFHADERQADGLWRLGCPAFFDVVDDDQLISPRNDRGLRLFREQALLWQWKPTPLTDAGMAKDEPVKAFEDTCDATRMAFAEFAPGVAPLTEFERIEQQLPEGWRAGSEPDAPAGSWEREGWEMARDVAIGRIRKREREQSREISDPWSGWHPGAGASGEHDPWAEMED